MNDREKFESWLKDDTTIELDDELTDFAWYVWKAALAESAAEHTRLRTDNYELLSKLTTAEMKIAELEKDRDEWKDATISANTRFKIAEDRVAELEKDKELLDWFNREKPCVHHVYDSGGFNFGLDVSTDVEENIFHSSDIRDAIRQAITNTGDTNEPD